MRHKVVRFLDNPIIRPGMDEAMGTNINGPSLIRVPDWLPKPLGRYYLYFGHHHGAYIRLAYAEQLAGPWTVYGPGTLRLEQTPCLDHIASPDAHVDEANQRIVLYYHGPYDQPSRLPGVFGRRAQLSFAAVSQDGIHFHSQQKVLGESYLRAFDYGGWTYAIAMPGFFYRWKAGFENYESGPRLFTDRMRHSAVQVEGDTLHIYYTNAGDRPESILHTTIDLRPDWLEWQAGEPTLFLQPEAEWEGANLPLEASARGSIDQPARQLRDPCIFEQDGRVYLLYACAGESGIAICEIS
jgi:hypothetical protein